MIDSIYFSTENHHPCLTAISYQSLANGLLYQLLTFQLTWWAMPTEPN
ncbi:MAG: hypothetical protein AB4352_03440 [Hormoscilla sp.]